MAQLSSSGDASVRRRVRQAFRMVPDLHYGLACSTSALEQVLRLVHDQYVARGYMDPQPSGWRLGVHHALPWTKVFVASDQDEVMGTVALIGDSSVGLPMDEIYGSELVRLRKQGRRLSEVSGLAIVPELRISGVMVLRSLLRVLLLHANEVAPCDDICLTVHPRHSAFYQRLFFPYLEEIGQRRAYGKVNGAPAVALRLDMRTVAERMPSIQDGTVDVSEAYQFFFGGRHRATTVERLRRETDRARLTPEQFRHFFGRHPALAEASRLAQSVVGLLYPSVDVETVIDRHRALMNGPSPSGLRFAAEPA